MAKNKVRIIIDTNVWISFLIGKSLSGLIDHLQAGKITIILSNEQLDELVIVLSRPKFHKYFSKIQILQFLDLIEVVSDIVEITSEIEICRDLKDNFLLAMAKDGKADYIVTGDFDLLELGSFEGAKIINYQNFDKEIVL
jgi:uncharacterized protein